MSDIPLWLACLGLTVMSIATKLELRALRRRVDRLGGSECQHDLQKPPTTIVIDGNGTRARCTVCGKYWFGFGEQADPLDPTEGMER